MELRLSIPSLTLFISSPSNISTIPILGKSSSKNSNSGAVSKYKPKTFLPFIIRYAKDMSTSSSKIFNFFLIFSNLKFVTNDA